MKMKHAERHRPELMFYELNTMDLWGKYPWKRGTGSYRNGTFAAEMNLLSQAMQYVDDSAEFRHDRLIDDDVKSEDIEIVSALDIDEDSVSNMLPDG